MYCSACQADLEETGGTQMNGCRHFLCTTCLIAAVKSSPEPGIKCEMRKGFFKCNGFVDMGELEFMVPEEIYSEYVIRLSENSGEGQYEANGTDESDDDDDEAGSQSLRGAGASNSRRVNGHHSNVKTTTVEDLDLPSDEKNCGWAHKASLMDELIRFQGLSSTEAADFIDELPILGNRHPITCPICQDDNIAIGDGVILKDCLHQFCKSCLSNYIKATTETAEKKCPYADGEYSCDEVLKAREIRALVNQEEYQKYFEDLSLRDAAKTLPNVFHCLTPDCKGFCVADDTNARLFQCPICNARNCVACKVIHPGTCHEYRRAIEEEERRARQHVSDEQNRVLQRQNEQLSMNEIQRRLTNKLWMRCPKCNTVIEKNGGCLHMKCRNCNLDFNWQGVSS